MLKDDILSYREMCELEGVQTLQRGMNFRMKPEYSVVLMSQRTNAPYSDRIHTDGKTIEYEGHDVIRKSYLHNPKDEDQPTKTSYGSKTQNGLFIQAAEDYKAGKKDAERVKVYEKILTGVWSLKGFFDLIDYRQDQIVNRKVFKFILKLSENQKLSASSKQIASESTRVIPTEVKKEVWKRDKGECVLCGEKKNLHFDHILPFSKGGTSLTDKNVRLLCIKHNLQKSDKIE